MPELLQLPYSILISIAIGYMSYWIAYHGFEVKDTLYKILLFSIPSLIILQRKADFEHYVYAALTVFIGAIWRIHGKELLFKILFRSKISAETNYDDVMNEFMQKITPHSEIFITMLDGTMYGSKVEKSKKDFPMGIYTNDSNGNYMLYIDRRKKANQSEWEDIGFYADKSKETKFLTYLPASQIKRIDFRV